jgi:hypothetical protein
MYLDVAMPLALFTVTAAAMLLSEKVEAKLKGAFEEKKLGIRDAVFLVAAMAVTVSLIVFVPQMFVMILFLFAYSMLLFVFSFLFSDFHKAKARLFYTVFSASAFIAGIVGLVAFGSNTAVAYGALAFFCLSGFAFVALMREENRPNGGERWSLAVLPPALFICLYVFFGRTRLWFPYLLDIYGVVFAILIVLYLGSLFTWKTSLIFVTLLTVMDIVLVLYVGSMVSAAKHVSGLMLPVLITLPIFPGLPTDKAVFYMSLGLGDFFFAGLLAVQTLRKFGRNLAVLSVIGMATSFMAFEAYLLNYELRAFPGTLMIICGWLPVVALGKLKKMAA